MSSDGVDNDQTPSLATSTHTPAGRPRVWRACEVCRKRKIRCDGKDPCGFCVAHDRACLFAPTHDHASASRQRDMDTTVRLKSLEDRLDRIIPLVEMTYSWLSEHTRIEQHASSRRDVRDGHSGQPSTSPSLPGLNPALGEASQSGCPMENESEPPPDMPPGSLTKMETNQFTADRGDEPIEPIHTIQPEGHLHLDPLRDSQTSWADRLAGRLARDSGGNSRFIGGAPVFALSQAVSSLRSAQLPEGSARVDSIVDADDEPTIDHLFFRPNVLYRPLEGLPSPETVEYPPIALSEAMVQMYFNKIHHTFPIVNKNRFLHKYRETMNGLRQGKPSSDSHWLCVLFAVYASAASLTKRIFEERHDPGFSSPKEYVGLEFYERSLYLYWHSFRTMKIDHVVCMALLSSCLAGWNTLAQSWVLAGQAVRAAQDIGLHRSIKISTMPIETVDYRRTVWWCVYGLDKILSVSLGRPSGINDDDCDVIFPSDQSETPHGNSPSYQYPIQAMKAFNSLSELYIIAGRIESRAHNIRFLKKFDNSADYQEVRQVVNSLDAMLDKWRNGQAFHHDLASDQGDMSALNLLQSFTFYACILNLHRPFMPDLNTSNRAYTLKSLEKCVEAAQGCIRVGAEVKQALPTSHHCQFCVQYLTISGVTLLRCLSYVSDAAPLLLSAQNCRNLLAELEDTWPGSKRCGALLEDLLEVCKRNTGNRANTMSATALNTYDPPQSSRSIEHKRTLDPMQRESDSNGTKHRRMQPDFSARAPEPECQSWTPSVHDSLSRSSMERPIIPPYAAMTPILPGNDKHLSSVTVSNRPLDFSYLATYAPFELADDIGVLLDYTQSSSETTGVPTHSQLRSDHY